MSLAVQQLHHVAVPVRDAARSRDFYAGVLGLQPIERPGFPFDGAWYGIGDRHVHLIEHARASFRPDGAGIDSKDVHFALRVASYADALTHLASLGYHVDSEEEAAAIAADVGLQPGTLTGGPADGRSLRVNPRSTAGFPQIYLLDPDGNVIEVNAASL